MDNELLNETLNMLCQNTNYTRYHDIFKKLEFNDYQMVYGKYLHVQPPIPNAPLDDHNHAKNLFSMKYNELYNAKHNINSFFDSFDDSSDND